MLSVRFVKSPDAVTTDFSQLVIGTASSGGGIATGSRAGHGALLQQVDLALGITIINNPGDPPGAALLRTLDSFRPSEEYINLFAVHGGLLVPTAETKLPPVAATEAEPPKPPESPVKLEAPVETEQPAESETAVEPGTEATADEAELIL